MVNEKVKGIKISLKFTKEFRQGKINNRNWIRFRDIGDFR